MSRTNEQKTTSKGESWSRGTNSRLPFDVNVMLHLFTWLLPLTKSRNVICLFGNKLSIQTWNGTSSVSCEILIRNSLTRSKVSNKRPYKTTKRLEYSHPAGNVVGGRVVGGAAAVEKWEHVHLIYYTYTLYSLSVLSLVKSLQLFLEIRATYGLVSYLLANKWSLFFKLRARCIISISNVKPCFVWWFVCRFFP